MSFGGRKQANSAVKIDERRLEKLRSVLIISGVMLQQVASISAALDIISAHGQNLAVRDSPEVRKLLNKRRPHRPNSQGRKRPIEPRPHFKSSGNNNLHADGTNYTDQDDCGVTEDEFNLICASVRVSAWEEENKKGHKARRRYLSVGGCVAVTLHFLRHATRRGELARQYGISKSCVDRTLEWTISHMRVSLVDLQDQNSSENTPALGSFLSCGCVDCCTHPRARVHPGEDMYYRGDKKIHFLTSQVVTDHTGKIMRLTIARGHNNDQGLFNISKMAEWLEERQMKPLLADLGYAGRGVIVPTGAEDILASENPTASALTNKLHASQRVLVENVNSWFKNWKFASVKCHLTPEFQAMALIVCGMLTNITSNPGTYNLARIINAEICS